MLYSQQETSVLDYRGIEMM